MRWSRTSAPMCMGLLLAGLLAPAAGAPARAGVAEGIAAYKAEDYATALRVFRAEADRGVPEAEFYLGWMYDNATGVDHDDSEAARWYRRAAEQGYAPAQHYLGLLYADGEGVGQDLAKAEAWFRRAALQGNAGAQYALGIMYRDGVVVEKDPVEALKWLTLAAEAGTPGEDDVAAARDGLAKTMSAEERAEAERRARDWRPVAERPARP